MLLLFFFLAAVAVLVTIVIIVTIDFDDPKDPKDCEPQEGGCTCTLKACLHATTPRSLGWYFIKEKGYCEELFDDGCNGCQCDGTRFSTKNACENSCLPWCGSGPCVIGTDR